MTSFPISAINPLNRQRLIIRYADLCRFRAERQPNRNFNALFGTVATIPAPFYLLMLLCKRDLKMARLSLESMARHASVVPQLILAHDESLTSIDVSHTFVDWPGIVQVWDRASVTQFHENAGSECVPIAVFCERHIFGFKLAACLRASTVGRTLYSDADILWFGDIQDLMEHCSHALLYGSHEAGDSLDEKTIQILPADSKDYLLGGNRCCAGFSIFNELDYKQTDLRDILSKIVEEEKIGRFAEQTVFNHLVYRWGNVIDMSVMQMYQPEKDIVLRNDLKYKLKAIHYPGRLKRQFWIDTY